MKIVRWIDNNILLLLSLFFLAFIPLYPKLPLVGISHVFVYIRLEDFFVTFAVIIYFIQLFRRKTVYKSVLTIPIFIFWAVGLVATILGLIFIFPYLQDPNITSDPKIYVRNALLFYIRHIEYLSLFFIAYSAMKGKKNITPVIIVTIITLIFVLLYGFGQRFIPQLFPAFSTMNEQFAKGIPLILNANARLQSTFAGHYDFAAYLVMLIPLIGSLVFGYKKIWIRVGLIILAFLSLIALLMTASRTSFGMYILAIIFMLVIQKQKKWIIPVIIISLLLLRSFTGIYSRYAATFSTVNTVVNAKTGKVIGYAEKQNNGQVTINNVQPSDSNLYAGSLTLKGTNVGTASSVIIQTQKGGAKSLAIQNLQGDFVIQKAQALDASITTRLQAEWPNAIRAFGRDILFGSGYSSITLATDGNYFRILGETGLLGFGSFLLIFLVFGIYVYKVLPNIDSPLAKSYILGLCAGLFGLALNALLIDVYEASKIAFILWLFIGSGVGILHMYQKHTIDFVGIIKKIFVSFPMFVFYLFVLTGIFFNRILNNFFVGDDFTWLRWVGDCKKILISGSTQCEPVTRTVMSYFLHSEGFFYRPGVKAYFLLMYAVGWLNPVIYHFSSLSLHFLTTLVVFLLTGKILKSKLFAFIASVLFLTLSSHAESIIWASSIGHLFVGLFTLAALLFFIYWKERKNIVYLIFSAFLAFLAPFFHESGVIAPFLIILYDLFVERKHIEKKLSHYTEYLLYIIPFLLYFMLKIASHSLWSAGDYQYNLLKLPLNIVGNLFGYFVLIVAGNPFMPFYQSVRNSGRHEIILAIAFVLLFLIAVVICNEFVYKKMHGHDKKIIITSFLLSVIPLLPFLGFGNITARYTYIASFGVILFFVFLLQKAFAYGRRVKTYSSFVVLIIVIAGVVSYQTALLHKENTDWQKAGMITDNTLQYMNDLYESLYSVQNPVFYFVDVPIRYGEAWVFPVGLSDAMWFDYKERNLTVHSVSNLQDAFTDAKGSASAEIFQFDKQGNIQQVHPEYK